MEINKFSIYRSTYFLEDLKDKQLRPNGKCLATESIL